MMADNNFAQIARNIDRRHPRDLYLMAALFAGAFAIGNAIALVVLL